MINYRKINRDVMIDTCKQYSMNPELQQMIAQSVNAQIMVSHEDDISQPLVAVSNTEYIVNGGRSFAEARVWADLGMKVAVLNFANNHSVGGAPYVAGAQEESLCRCSTLLPCLEALYKEFYKKHIDLYEAGKLNHMGNDDLIYTPNVCVFKTDEQTDPIIPVTMPRDKWYMVDVITCAAPELHRCKHMPADYENQIGTRIKKILDIANMQGAEVLILGAWGCGAFRNPEDVVARVFREHLMRYNFKKVVFALGKKDYDNSAFYKEFGNLTISTQDAGDVGDMRREYTPKFIDSLAEGEIFVFGSNICGKHYGGAAAFAHSRFGAEWGVGEGITGQCYALPTMEGGVDYINKKVRTFLNYAQAHQDLKFLVTPVACGIAGYTPSEIAPLFKDAINMNNVILPKEFVDVILKL